MQPILLTTLNATYFHCAFGLRYLRANLKELKPSCALREFTINEKPVDIAQEILKLDPQIVGFSVYIWNTQPTYEVISILKRVRPDLVVVLGGPEVSYETEPQAIYQICDYVVKGEGERLFYDLCKKLLGGEPPKEKILTGPLPPLETLASPYPEYSDEDIAHRVIYVEASRGCPFKCEFCLSSLDESVRPFPLDKFLADMETLIQKGVKQFKFVDRTFNLNIAISQKILSFFLQHIDKNLFLHFEMIPDRLPDGLKALIKEFPAGSIQFEIGVQTWNTEVSKLISRRQDYEKVKSNFGFLVKETDVHIHADLIVGLPGETIESFGAGFDQLAALAPHEIQVGILKRLKGTPIIRHDRDWQMVYAEHPPFAILQTKTMDFITIQKMNRFAKFWDLYANSGNFKHTMAVIRELAGDSLFREFYRFTDFLSERHLQRHGIALLSLVESAWLYLTQERGQGLDKVRTALIEDYAGTKQREIPRFLLGQEETLRPSKTRALPPRQAQHLA